MKKILMSAAAFAAMTVFAGAASAQGYVGATVGISNFSVDYNVPFADSDKQDTAFKVYGGYHLAPHWAIEAAYIDFGTTSVNVGPLSGGIDVSAFIVNGAYRWDFSPKWTGVARLGLANVSSDPKGIVRVNNSSDSSIKLYGGIGIEYAVTKNVKVIGALDLTSFEVSNSDGSLNSVTGGVQFSF